MHIDLVLQNQKSTSKMSDKNKISHTGVVKSITSKEIEVMIVSESACSSCKTKSVCSMAESKEKAIHVEKTTEDFKIGDRVMLYMNSEMGTYAVIIAYVLPFVLMMTVLFLGHYNKWADIHLGIGVILALGIYFTMLFLMKDKLKTKISFTVKKINNQD